MCYILGASCNIDSISSLAGFLGLLLEFFDSMLDMSGSNLRFCLYEHLLKNVDGLSYTLLLDEMVDNLMG